MDSNETISSSRQRSIRGAVGVQEITAEESAHDVCTASFCQYFSSIYG